MFKNINHFGKFIIFQFSLMPLYFQKPARFKEIMQQINIIGIKTLFVILLTAIFTGMVMSVQFYQAFHRFGAEGFIGYTIFIAIAKELGPVFGSLMLISRAISSMAAELGTMRVTEQIDAIDILGIDSRKLLVIPRIIATTISLPILIIIFDFVANISAYIISTKMLGINPITYQNTIIKLLNFSDIYTGLIKGVIFGFLVSSIGVYIGFFAKQGARGVGEATTNAVVYSAIIIFAANYFLSIIFLFLDI
jgi:phospholipid/cholesterol/gamma-HCH transport system permease protein